MSATVEELKAQVLGLQPGARAYLAEVLLESLEEEHDFQVGPEWQAEVKRRARAIDEGRAELVPLDEALSRLREGRAS